MATIEYDGFTITAELTGNTVEGFACCGEENVPEIRVIGYSLDPTYTQQELTECHGVEILAMTPAQFVMRNVHTRHVLAAALAGGAR